MTLANDLPIYRDVFKLTSMLIDYVAEFPKQHRYTIGEKMINTSLALFEFVALAFKCRKNRDLRVKYISDFLLKFELLKVLIRLCNEKKIFTEKQSAQVALLTTSIGKQATGWRNN